MASITQTIPNYTGGISEQPDQLKVPGQVKSVQNAIPDVVQGLYKRPGARRIGTTPLANFQSGGSIFHYYRDETEGSYIGQVDENGFVRIWSCNDGTEKNVHYITDNTAYSASTAAHTAIASATDLSPITKYQDPSETHYAYLKTKGVGTSESIQALTINDTTFLVNRDREVKTTGTTTARPHKNFAYVELLRTENGRQYGLNIFDSTADSDLVSIPVVTRLKITSDELGEGHGSGQCLGIGTEVYQLEPSIWNIGGTNYTSTSTLPSGYAFQNNNTQVLQLHKREKLALDLDDKYNDDYSPDWHDDSGDTWADEYFLQNNYSTSGIYGTKDNRFYKLRNTSTGQQIISALVTADGAAHDGSSTFIIGQIVTALQAATAHTGLSTATSMVDGGGGTISSSTVAYGDLPFTISGDTSGHNIVLTYKTTATPTYGQWRLTRCNSPTNASLGDTTHPSGTPYWDELGRDRPHQTHDLITSAEHTVSPTVGTVLAVTSQDKRNLTFRLSILGQQGVAPHPDNDATIQQHDYGCSYNREITLLHGGEGYALNDVISVAGPSSKGKLSSGSGTDSSPGIYNNQANFTVKVTGIETAKVRANIKAVRPAPTPFDADTSISTDAILAGIVDEIENVTINGNPLNSQIIGNGVYIWTDADADDFNVEIVDKDLMRVMQTSINDVTSLPFQSKHGLIVQIANTRQSAEDDYYVRFHGENGKDGPGSWKECAEPGIVKSFNAATLPHILQRQDDGDFLIKQYEWEDREVGDDVTNQIPSFVDKTINKVLFFRNRLAFLSGENVITSRPGSIAAPNFWSNTALTVSASDPIDISCSSHYPSELYDAIEITAGLLCFSSNAQFLLASDDTIMNPDTAKLRAVSWYNYDTVTPPVSLGQTVGFIDNSNKYSRFMEMANVGRENEPAVVNTSQVVPTLLQPNSDLFTNSRENNLVLFGKTNSDTVVGFRYLNIAEKRQQASWFKWKFKNSLKYHFIINDQYFFLDSNNFLQSINLVQADTDLSITQDSTEYLIHLDNHTTVANGVYSASTNLTTFTNQSDWIDQVTNGSTQLVVVDTDSNTARLGRYAECTVINGDDFTVPGDWSSATLNIGYLYDYQVDFPRFYLQKSGDNAVQSDINSKLTVHRMKLNFGKIGLYETTLTRVGKSDYTEVYESTDLDEYEASDAPYLAEKIKDIPIYERNTNLDVTLKSTHPAPATLRSMSWEGDWSPMHYRRV